jgi:hypothetical protein
VRDALEVLAGLSLLAWIIASLATFGASVLVGFAAATLVRLWRNR